MTIKLSSLKANLDREKKGDWIAFPDWPGVEFKVSSLNLPEFAAARATEIQRLNIIHKMNIPPDVMTVAQGTLLNTYLLQDWRGLDEPYSPERAREVMTDPSYRHVINAVWWCANEISAIEVKFAEDTVKNSAEPSVTG